MATKAKPTRKSKSHGVANDLALKPLLDQAAD
jgi:hypothetical protein